MGSYEIAFAWHKLGKNAMAVALDELLLQYQTGTDPAASGAPHPGPQAEGSTLRDDSSYVLHRLPLTGFRSATPAAPPSDEVRILPCVRQREPEGRGARRSGPWT